MQVYCKTWRTAKIRTGALRNTECYSYVFDGIKKTSIASLGSAFLLAKKSLILCHISCSLLCSQQSLSDLNWSTDHDEKFMNHNEI